MENKEIDFYGETRKYSNERNFDKEWNIKLFANDKLDVKRILEFFTEWGFNHTTEEFDYCSDDGHIICKKIK